MFVLILLILIGLTLPAIADSVVHYDGLIIDIPDAQRVLPPRKSYIAACAVGKDVDPDDITEWVVHHLALGVGHIYWYDHNSSVDHTRRMAPFVQAGQLTWMRTSNQRNVQLQVYHHCADMFGAQHEWLLMADTDEFLWLKDAQHQQHETEKPDQGVHYPLHMFLQQYEAYAGLGVNWWLYGSGGFTARPAEKDTKVIAQRAAVVDELFRPLADDHITVNHTSQHIVLLHYILRSRQEYEAKVARGAADGNRRTLEFFDELDRHTYADCSLVLPVEHSQAQGTRV